MEEFDENDIVDLSDNESEFTLDTSEEEEEEEEHFRVLELNEKCKLEQAVYDLKFKQQNKSITNLDLEVDKNLFKSSFLIYLFSCKGWENQNKGGQAIETIARVGLWLSWLWRRFWGKGKEKETSKEVFFSLGFEEACSWSRKTRRQNEKDEERLSGRVWVILWRGKV